MILAYATPGLLILFACIYLIVAVPVVFIVSLLIFIIFQFQRFGVFVSPCFPNAILPFALANACLTFYFFYWVRQPQDVCSASDYLWIASVASSIVLLVISALQARHPKPHVTKGCG